MHHFWATAPIQAEEQAHLVYCNFDSPAFCEEQITSIPSCIRSKTLPSHSQLTTCYAFIRHVFPFQNFIMAMSCISLRRSMHSCTSTVSVYLRASVSNRSAGSMSHAEPSHRSQSLLAQESYTVYDDTVACLFLPMLRSFLHKRRITSYMSHHTAVPANCVRPDHV